jgi:hypothetical protein
MTDREFADWLKSVPRERTWEEVELTIIEHDRERGPWVANQVVHHEYGESAG